ncbi:hypothetical protein THAOC_18863 [Thalassiosira oceanica]|uniref:Uncharacterized protein n=1 Tax=Thalassiosira oceanica TaxID=159749 RepID=K0S682_THAOC|nr:hypothetical protein THAOC_18863 [Thalassiosira oceanica]|eukprot:EJK60730.1 hypothetical protein THAOC_18863 [Thalassiosira oceanica]
MEGEDTDAREQVYGLANNLVCDYSDSSIMWQDGRVALENSFLVGLPRPGKMRRLIWHPGVIVRARPAKDRGMTRTPLHCPRQFSRRNKKKMIVTEHTATRRLDEARGAVDRSDLDNLYPPACDVVDVAEAPQLSRRVSATDRVYHIVHQHGGGRGLFVNKYDCNCDDSVSPQLAPWVCSWDCPKKGSGVGLFVGLSGF